MDMVPMSYERYDKRHLIKNQKTQSFYTIVHKKSSIFARELAILFVFCYKIRQKRGLNIELWHKKTYLRKL